MCTMKGISGETCKGGGRSIGGRRGLVRTMEEVVDVLAARLCSLLVSIVWDVLREGGREGGRVEERSHNRKEVVRTRFRDPNKLRH